MNQTTIEYYKVVISLALFVPAYFFVPPGIYRQVLIYYLMLLGLYRATVFPEIVVLVNGLGLVLLLTGPVQQWPLATAGLVLLLMGTTVIPLFFAHAGRQETERFRDRRGALENEFYRLQSLSATCKLKRQNLDNEIDRINQLYVLGRELVEHMDLHEVAENVVRVLSANPGIRSASIYSWEESGWKPLHISGTLDQEKWCLFVENQVWLRETMDYRILESPAWIGNDAVIYMPVRLEKDLLAALFMVIEKEYAGLYIEKASIFIPQIALGLKRTRLFHEVEDRSRHDGLTGLFLRRHFLERLQSEIQRARRYATGFSLLIGDIDHFKKVNDTYGHPAGDQMLRGVADRINDSIRPGDIAGRYGGEEFVVLLPLAMPEDAARIAAAIRTSIERHAFDIGDRKIHASISIGVSHYPRDGSSARELLAAADGALYWVKNNGRNSIKDYGEIA
jgi:diguanylate cyclase (GGDEF)-like protein